MQVSRCGPRNLFAVTLVALLAAAPGDAAAQEPTPLAAGTRVRVKSTQPGGGWVRGELLALSADSLRLLAAGGAETLAFATSAIAHLEVSRGRHAQTGRGALLGAGIGATAGLLLGLAAAAEECTGFCPVEVGPGEILAVTAVLGGLGAGIGALIGAASRGERWERVAPPWVGAWAWPVPRRLAIGLALLL